MATIPAKQVIRVLSSLVRVSNFSASGVDDTATTVITTALSTAGNGGVSVPLQVSSSVETIGVITASPHNRVEIYDATSKDKILATNGEEVYGRLTQSGGVYTLAYFTLDNTGTEAAHNFTSSTPIDFEFAYRFDFARLPAEAIIGISTRNVSQDPGGAGGRTFTEAITVTATNTLSGLSLTPTSADSVILVVNGVIYDPLGGGSADFSVNVGTRALTWSAANAGFSLETTDRVVARYTTNQ